MFQIKMERFRGRRILVTLLFLGGLEALKRYKSLHFFK